MEIACTNMSHGVNEKKSFATRPLKSPQDKVAKVHDRMKFTNVSGAPYTNS
jgi:hypothetical protein